MKPYSNPATQRGSRYARKPKANPTRTRAIRRDKKTVRQDSKKEIEIDDVDLFVIRLYKDTRI